MLNSQKDLKQLLANMFKPSQKTQYVKDAEATHKKGWISESDKKAVTGNGSGSNSLKHPKNIFRGKNKVND